MQQARILLAVHRARIPILLAEYTANPSTMPSMQLMASTTSQLRATGDKSSNRLLLEYVFQQKLQQHQLTPPDYLSLAQARLDLDDTAAALELLHRLIMLPSVGTTSSPGLDNSSLYANLDSAASLLEQSGHSTEALPFLTTLANFTPWNPAYRLRLAMAQLKTQQTSSATIAFTAIASSGTTSYPVRTQAATALRQTSGSKQFDSAELTLLAASTITPQQASQSYFVPACMAAATEAPASAQLILLRNAMATSPSETLRLAIFRAEFALGQYDQALAAVKPLLQSANGLYRPQNWYRDDSSSQAINSSPVENLNSNESIGTPLPALLRTLEEKITFALEVATLYEKNGDDQDAVNYLRTAVALNRDVALGQTITTRLVGAEARIQLANANQSRRPVIQPALNQAVVVRPRLTTNSQKVQP